MRKCSSSPFLRLVVLPLTLVAFLSGCSQKWVELEPPLADAIERRQPDSVRLTVDGQRFMIHEPAVMNDSIVGQRNRLVRIGGEPVLSRFALDDIQSVEEPSDDLSTLEAVVAGWAVIMKCSVHYSCR